MLGPAIPLVLLVLAASVASAETIWLRGRGDDVWIERDGEMREPRDDRKGFTRVSTPVRPAAARAGAREWRGGWNGGPPIAPVPLIAPVAPIPDYVSYPAHGCDAPCGYGLGLLDPAYHHRYRFDDRRHRLRDHRHDHLRFGDHRHHRHRFGHDERRRPEVHRGVFGGHRHGGFGRRGGDRRGR
jgi:hypothetical protein